MAVRFIRKALTDEAIIRIADKMTPKVRRAFLNAIKAAKDTVNLDALAKAIEARNANQVLAILGLDKAFAGALKGVGIEVGIASVRDALQQTFLAGANTAISELPKTISTQLSFNLMNPKAVDAIESYTFDLIRDLTVDAKQTIQEVLTRAFQEGGHPYEQAIEIRDAIGLTRMQERALLNYRNELETGKFRDALDRALRDGRYDRSLLASLKNGKGLSQDRIDAMVDRYRQNYLTHRAQTIARTETIRASNSGQRELWRQAQEQGLLGVGVRRKWVTSGDDRTCDECDDLDGKLAGLDEEFEPGIMEPPDPHPSCRCSITLSFPGKTAVA